MAPSFFEICSLVERSHCCPACLCPCPFAHFSFSPCPSMPTSCFVVVVVVEICSLGDLTLSSPSSIKRLCPLAPWARATPLAGGGVSRPLGPTPARAARSRVNTRVSHPLTLLLLLHLCGVTAIGLLSSDRPSVRPSTGRVVLTELKKNTVADWLRSFHSETFFLFLFNVVLH